MYPSQQVDDARTAKQKAEIAYAQAVTQAAASNTAIGTIDSAVANVEARRATLALAERDLRDTIVKAPHDGRVTGLNVETGEYVALAQSLFTLVVSEDWFASANFRETELGRIAVGSCAIAYSLIDRSIPIKGRVDGIGWGVTDQDKINLPRDVPYVAKSVNWVRVEQRFPVRVRLENPPENSDASGSFGGGRDQTGGQMLTPGSGLVADLVDPFPGRLARSLEISIVCMLVVLVSMTFQIPDPALSAYLVFFAAKEDSGLNILMSIVLIVVVTIVIAMTFGLALLTLNAPEGRILVIAAVSFVAFFLGAASKLSPLASTMGLIIAYALDLFGSTPLGELTTRGLLYAWLFVSMPMLVFICYNILFGRRPVKLLREAVAMRLRAASTALRERNDENDMRLAETCKGGNEELLKALKVAGLRCQPGEPVIAAGDRVPAIGDEA